MLTRENLLMLGASFLIAIGIRVALSPSISTIKEQRFDAKLEIRGLPDNLTVVDEPKTVEMKATGTAQYLDQLEKSSVIATVDLSNARLGKRKYVITSSPPSRARVTVTPLFQTVSLDVQKLSSIEKAVEVEPSGQTLQDFAYDGATTIPEVVTIVGAESILARVKVVRVNLELQLVRPGKTFMLPVEILDEANHPVPYLKARPSEVMVSPAVAAAPSIKRVLVTPNWTGQPAFGYEVVSFEIKPSQIEVRGESGMISRIATFKTEPVSLAGLKESTKVKTKVRVPAGLKVTVSNEVQIVIKIAPQPGMETHRN